MVLKLKYGRTFLLHNWNKWLIPFYLLFTILFNFTKALSQESYRIIEQKVIQLQPPENQFIGKVFDLAIDTDQSAIFVCDYDNHTIWKFSKDGEYLNQIGQQGKGPGEFIHPVSISLKEDTVAVLDEGNRRVSFFSKKGEFFYSVFISNAGLINGIELSRTGNRLLISESLGIKNLICLSLQGNVLWESPQTPTAIMQPVKLPGGNISLTKDNRLIVANIRKYDVNLMNWKSDTLIKIQYNPATYEQPALDSRQDYIHQKYFSLLLTPLQVDSIIVVQRVNIFKENESNKKEFLIDLFTINGEPIQSNLRYKKLPFIATDYKQLYAVDYSPVKNIDGNPAIIVARLVKTR